MKGIAIYSLAFVLGLFVCVNASAQTDTNPKKPKLKDVPASAHHEVVDDEYIEIAPEDMKTSPAYRVEGSSYFTIQVNTDGDGENILNDAGNEPSITVDPTNPDKMVIGWRQFNTITSNFRQAGYAYTLDGGESWTFPGVIEPGVFRSDPVLAADMDGNIFYNSLTTNGGDFLCNEFKMEPGTTEWDEGIYALGGDKQWITIDQTGSMGDGNHYAYWTASFSICWPDNFTRSSDGGESYEPCVAVAGYPRWGTLATSNDGTLYTAGWSDDGYIVSRSSTAQNPEWPVTWDGYSVVDLDGYPGFAVGPNPGGLLGQTSIGVDNSDGPHAGNIYVLTSVERASNSDPLDVMFARSRDGGLTWDDPIRINNDISTINWQWFGTMSVAPNGRIDVVWLDTREGVGYNSALFYSYSVDGGENFSQNEQISEYFNPHVGWPQQDKMGDYFHMFSDDDYAHLAWANTLNEEQDVYYSRINPWFVGTDENAADASLPVTVFPNPANENLTIKVKVEKQGTLELSVIDLLGKEVYSESQATNGNETHTAFFDTSSLPEGVYFARTSLNGKSDVQKVIVAH